MVYLLGESTHPEVRIKFGGPLSKVSTQNIQRSLGQMSLLFGQYVRGSAAGARVFEYMNMEPTIPIQGGLQITNNNLRGQVNLNNVTFTYPSRPEQSVLEDFTLEIPGGKICALVGASGGGKSTVASLLERFYDCDNGSLTIDGIDIKTLDLRWLRRNCIGYINQVFFFFQHIVLVKAAYRFLARTC